jgi:hypothetical protein
MSFIHGSRGRLRLRYRGYALGRQSECYDSRKNRERGRDADCCRESAAEGASGSEISGSREHRDRERDAEGPAEKAGHIEDPGCLANFVTCYGTQDGVLSGWHGQ